jgi:hypothetical protein
MARKEIEKALMIVQPVIEFRWAPPVDFFNMPTTKKQDQAFIPEVTENSDCGNDQKQNDHLKDRRQTVFNHFPFIIIVMKLGRYFQR